MRTDVDTRPVEDSGEPKEPWIRWGADPHGERARGLRSSRAIYMPLQMSGALCREILN